MATRPANIPLMTEMALGRTCCLARHTNAVMPAAELPQRGIDQEGEGPEGLR